MELNFCVFVSVSCICYVVLGEKGSVVDEKMGGSVLGIGHEPIQTKSKEYEADVPGKERKRKIKVKIKSIVDMTFSHLPFSPFLILLSYGVSLFLYSCPPNFNSL